MGTRVSPSDSTQVTQLVNENTAYLFRTYLKFHLTPVLEAFVNRRLVTSLPVQSKTAKAGEREPESYQSDLTVKFMGDLGVEGGLDYLSCVLYIWIIIQIHQGHGGNICIVVIFNLLVREVGWAHPKILEENYRRVIDPDINIPIINNKG